MACPDCNDTSIPVGPTGPPGNAALPIQDETVQIVAVPTFINFEGSGVTVTASGAGALVTIPGTTSAGGQILHNSSVSFPTGEGTSSTTWAELTDLTYTSLPANTMSNGDYITIDADLRIVDKAGSAENGVSFRIKVGGTVIHSTLSSFDMYGGSTEFAHLNIVASRITSTLMHITVSFIPASSTGVCGGGNFLFHENVACPALSSNQVISIEGINLDPAFTTQEAKCSQLLITYFKKP